MSATQTGLLAGLVLGVAATNGFAAFVVTLAVGVIGLVVGRALDGGIDVASLIGRGRDR